MIVIDLAMPQDAEGLEKVRIAAWRCAYKGIMKDDFLDALSPDHNIDFLRKHLPINSNGNTVIKAEFKGEVVGFAILKEADRFDKITEISALNIAPESWRLSYGSQLMDYAINLIKQKGEKAIELWCLTENHRARNFYIRSGFRESGRTRVNDWLNSEELNELHFIKTLD